MTTPFPGLPSAEERSRLAAEVATLYDRLDVPPPSMRFPVAPLGPLVERFHVDGLSVQTFERSGLTLAAVEAMLREDEVIGPTTRIGEEGAGATPLAGFLYALGPMAYVFAELDDPTTRRRFSVAHELGHILLHYLPLLGAPRDQAVASPDYTDRFLPDEAAGIAGGDDEDDGAPNEPAAAPETAGDGYARQEREANGFASELLMPEALVRALASDRARAYAMTGDALVDRVANEMMVSRAAMRLRFAVLGIDQAT